MKLFLALSGEILDNLINNKKVLNILISAIVADFYSNISVFFQVSVRNNFNTSILKNIVLQQIVLA